MKFVMTGHRGLIGSFLLERLKREGHVPLLLLDKREDNDIKDIENFRLQEKADVMIHLASFCKINKTIENPDLAFENNVLGTYKVLEFCRKNGIKKIISASSSRILSKEKNPYTASKIYGEELVKGYSQCYGMDYLIVRPSTVYGPFNDKSKRLIHVWIINALNGEDLKIMGDENKNLDFTYIDDFLDGFAMVMNEKNAEFDISSGESTKLSQVADQIIRLAGKGTKKFCSPEIAQPQEIDLDTNAIKKMGFEPKISIEEGIKRTFEWYKKRMEEREKAEKFYKESLSEILDE